MEREKRIEGLDGESVTDVFRGEIEWREGIERESSTRGRARAREREREERHSQVEGIEAQPERCCRLLATSRRLPTRASVERGPMESALQ